MLLLIIIIALCIDQLLLIIIAIQYTGALKKEKPKEVHPYQVYINADGKLIYEDQYSIALIIGLVTEKFSDNQNEVLFGSKHVTKKNQTNE